MKIIDNFLDQNNFEKIKNHVSSEYFPWFYNDSILDKLKSNSIYDHQFIHFVIDSNNIKTDEKTIEIFRPLIEKINPKYIVRLKLNLNTGTHSHYENGLHTDIENDDSINTAIYYINSNNGCTVFEDGTEVDSIENRLVVFNSTLRHQARTATDSKARYVANVNYMPV